jgi:hypothetical protein
MKDDDEKFASQDFKRFEEKLDDISEHCWSIDKTLVLQQSILDEHQRRSTAIEEQIKPMLELKAQIKGCINLIYIVAALAAIVECVRLFVR